MLLCHLAYNTVHEMSENHLKTRITNTEALTRTYRILLPDATSYLASLMTA